MYEELLFKYEFVLILFILLHQSWTILLGHQKVNMQVSMMI